MKSFKVGDVLYVLSKQDDEFCLHSPVRVEIINDEKWIYGDDYVEVKLTSTSENRFLLRDRIRECAFYTLEEAWEMLEHQVHLKLNELSQDFESYRNSVNKLLKEKNAHNTRT